MTDTQQPEGSSGARSFLTCLGIGCAVVFVLVLIASIAGFMLKDKIRDSMVDGAYEGMEEEISSTNLDPKEKGEVIGQIARLRDAIKTDEVSMEEFGQLMERVGTSPFSAVLLCATLRAGMQGPDFTDEERDAADDTFERYIQGRVDGTLTRANDNEIAKVSGQQQQDSGFHVSVEGGSKPEQIRAGVALAKTTVEEAEIPAVEQSPDLSGILKDIIDPAID